MSSSDSATQLAEFRKRSRLPTGRRRAALDTKSASPNTTNRVLGLLLSGSVVDASGLSVTSVATASETVPLVSTPSSNRTWFWSVSTQLFGEVSTRLVIDVPRGTSDPLGYVTAAVKG